jgi:hypothetical protein
MMRRQRVERLNVNDAPIEELPPSSDMWVPGHRRRVLAHDPETGAKTYVSEIPPRYRRDHERAYREQHPPGRFEHHRIHEEGAILDGRYDFGGWYDFDAMSYLNHPPTWVHPADQCVPQGARLIMKLSGPLAFDYHDIPSDWDGTEFPLDPAAAAPYRGVTATSLQAGSGETRSDGSRWQRLWHDPLHGWTTWFVTIPAGWRGSGSGRERPGGDEVFVIGGDVALVVGDEVQPLVAGDYVCDPDVLRYGGMAESSRDGALLLRWTRNAEPLDEVGAGTGAGEEMER